MADVSQVETSFSFEPRTAPVTPAEPKRPQGADANNSSRPSEPSEGGRSDAAFNVDLSNAAQQLSSNDNAAPAGSEADEAPVPDSSVRTSASGVENSDDAGSRTNQVTSFESERTGNGNPDASEASRTLGQVVDTFA
ncbi:MAG: hypothetical protein GEU87_12725 [Alphaproteobacteria bacterium]|nr:hypothetical protein [Alphaproteobacteria bacterium]